MFKLGPIFFKNKFGGGRIFFFKPYSLKITNFSLSMSTKKGGPNFTISPIPAFGGHLLQIFCPYTTEAQANFPSVLAKSLWSFLAGEGGGGVEALASGHPNTL
jgi:hypothetical protein